ncbi:MAG: class I SAM-dependent methyltransferase [Parcubacteria group bacterium]
MKEINCPNCQSQKSKIVLDVSKEKDIYLDCLKIDYKKIKKLYLECKECGLIYRNSALNEKEKKLLYKHYRDEKFKKENKSDYFYRIISLPKRQSENYQKCLFLKKFLRKKGSLLDIGCGAGAFLYTFKNYYFGWEVFGIEPTEGFADIAKEKGIRIIYGYLKKNTFNRKFDLITLNHVLEHIEDFKEMLLLIKRYFKKDGLLYIEVPSAREIGRAPKSHDQFMSPHLIIFSKKILENILAKLGYSVIISEDLRSIRNYNTVRIIAKIS